MRHATDSLPALLAEAFATFREGILLLDADDGVLAFNPAFEQAWDLLGVPLVRSLTFSENLEAAAALGRAAAETWLALRRGATDPFLVPMPGGAVLRVAEYPMASGGRLVNCSDVTAERQRELALVESEYRYRLLVETITEGVIVLDRDHRVVFANPRFVSWFGGSDMALLGRALEDLVREESRAGLAPLFGGGEPRSVEAALACPGGRFVLISAAPLKGASGRRSGHFAIITDVTELRAASERLRQSEERFRGIIETTPFGILTLDADGRVRTVNPAFLAITGAEEAAFAGADPADWLPEARPALADLFAAAETGAARGESRLRRAADLGHARIVLSRMGGAGDAWLLIVEDATEARQMEETLRHTAKLALLGEMSASLAHEISQPLNIIRLAAESALLSLDDGDAATIRGKFETIGAQSDRLRETIDYMQAFSRRDGGPRKSFDTVAAVGAAVALMTPQCSSLGIAVAFAPPDRPVPVVGHPRQLEQVLVNLLRNAVDAIVERRAADPVRPGRIEVTLGEEIGRDRRPWVRIAVTDTGTGVRPEDLPHLFEPFFTRKTEGLGTGLGLSISLDLVAAMGGRIEAENLASGGCRFRVTLPRAEAPPEEAAPPPAVPDDAGDAPAMTILVADDEPLATAEIQRFLERGGHRVVTVGSGRAARAALEAEHVDILVTDLSMPDGDGFQLIAETAAEYPHVAIVVVTGQPLRDREALADLEGGVDAVLRKPVSLRELAATLKGLA